ncbi:MAG: FAD:protein FMN transferase [Clostridiales bacterium]|nr:FAD:protein FMN transferase [Clostridiales bacterium]
MKKIWIVCFAVLLITIIVVPRNSQESRRFKASFLDLFDTYTELTIYADNEAEATRIATAARDELRACHRLFDIYNTYEGSNNLKTVNDSAGIAPVEVDRRIIDLLLFGKEMYAATGGQVNIAMGSVLSLWHEKRTVGIADPENASLPDMDALEAAARHMDIDQLIIDETLMTVYLADSAMSLDVGAIAKGYATERTAQLMMADGVDSALLSVGGNVRAVGVRGDGTPWQVGVQNPGAESGTGDIATVSLKDRSMVTSGSYQRYYTVDGVQYHHIIDPHTLMPARYARSVTILTQDSGVADTLSTALFTVSAEKGKAMLSGFSDAEALWVEPDGTILETDGFSD